MNYFLCWCGYTSFARIYSPTLGRFNRVPGRCATLVSVFRFRALEKWVRFRWDFEIQSGPPITEKLCRVSNWVWVVLVHRDVCFLNILSGGILPCNGGGSRALVLSLGKGEVVCGIHLRARCSRWYSNNNWALTTATPIETSGSYPTRLVSPRRLIWQGSSKKLCEASVTVEKGV